MKTLYTYNTAVHYNNKNTGKAALTTAKPLSCYLDCEAPLPRVVVVLADPHAARDPHQKVSDITTTSTTPYRSSATQKETYCIGRESNPGLAELILWMATANFTTKPPMLLDRSWFCLIDGEIEVCKFYIVIIVEKQRDRLKAA